MPNIITFLGTGTSTGVPTPGCSCTICQSAQLDPSSKNNRLRTSVLLQSSNQQNILIDTSPDLRTQLLQYKIKQIDHVIITHDHADHVHGIDDLRPLCFFQSNPQIPIHTTDYTAKRLTVRFDYIFANKQKIIGGGIPRLSLQEIQTDFTPHKIGCDTFTFFEFPHGHISTLGFYHQGLLYMTDCQEIPSPLLTKLQQLEIKLLVIDTTRRQPHATHLHLDQALHYITKLSPQNVRLIHLSHDFDHDKLNQELKARKFSQTSVAFDGEVLTY